MDELHGRQKIIAQLVEARLEQGVSQAELARRVGTQRSNICRLESGVQNPTLDMILKIASALGKDVSLLLDDKEEPMSNIYSLRIYDTELMRFSMEKQGLSGLVAEILYTNEEQTHLQPLANVNDPLGIVMAEAQGFQNLIHKGAVFGNHPPLQPVNNALAGALHIQGQ